MIDEEAINIYTDGSSFQKPRRGGFGILIITVNENGHEVPEEIELPGFKHATNNQMELFAVIKALEEAYSHPQLSQFPKICIYSDSRYVTDNYLNAIFRWSQNKWLNNAGKPIENTDLWKQFIKLYKNQPCPIKIQWVKGHSKNQHNKTVDKIAKRSAKSAINKPLSHVEVRRKTTEKKVELGSVKMEGQDIKVRIITTEFLKTQKLSKYKYQVLSKKSKYFDNVDVIYGKEIMRAGHHYKITVNDDNKNPRVIKVIKELER
jgi:ribonuclease HI